MQEDVSESVAVAAAIAFEDARQLPWMLSLGTPPSFANPAEATPKPIANAIITLSKNIYHPSVEESINRTCPAKLDIDNFHKDIVLWYNSLTRMALSL
jgi:hypothetical protein